MTNDEWWDRPPFPGTDAVPPSPSQCPECGSPAILPHVYKGYMSGGAFVLIWDSDGPDPAWTCFSCDVSWEPVA
jgi:hypothetical protein